MHIPPRGTPAPKCGTFSPPRGESASNGPRAAWTGRGVPVVGPRRPVARLRPCPMCSNRVAAVGRRWAHPCAAS